MTVGKICQRNLDTACTFESVRTAAQRMNTRNVGTLIVKDDDDRPVGIVTDRDLALRVVAHGLDPFTTNVTDVMTADLELVREDVRIEDALRRMRARGVRRLPVVDAHGHCVGIVSMDDVLAHLAGEFAVLGRLLETSTPGLE